MVGILGVLFLILLALSVPLGFSMGMGAAVALALDGSVPLIVIVQRMFGGSDSTTLLAVPFYILAGTLMEEIGISARLVTLARAMVGHIQGSFGMVTVLAELLFSGISGSTAADVSAIGTMMIPARKKAGYKTEEAVAIVAAATSVGSLVPPSLGMIVLAVVMEISVGALFVAGFLPAAAISVVLMVLIYFQARSLDLPRDEKATCGQLAGAAKDALVAMMMPIIIFGGILGGITTATEAGAVACLYGLVIGVFVYRKLDPPRLLAILERSALLTGVVMFAIATATLFAWILATQQVPRNLGNVVFSVSRDPLVFLAGSALVFIFIGGLLDGVPAMLILVPVFYPMAKTLGIDPLHFAIVAYYSINIGLFLPPWGVGFLLAAGIGKIPMERAVRPFLPFLVALLIGLVLLITVPWLTLVLPQAAGLAK